MRRCAPAATAGWLLPHTGDGFVLMLFGAPDAVQRDALGALARGAIPVQPLVVLPPGEPGPPTCRGWKTPKAWWRRRFDAQPGTAYLIRPDQHVAARWRRFDAGAVRAALARATGQEAQR